MGCSHSKVNRGKLEMTSEYLKMLDQTYSHSTCNENELDRTHFSSTKMLLGIGGFGIVRLVEKVTGDDQGTFYALKSLSKSAVLKRQNGLKSVMQELNALIAIGEHPFICNIKYAFQDTSFLYLILELASCGDLRANLRLARGNRLPEAMAQFIIAQVAVAVAYCHSKRILHRDVKPENILISSTGYIKLTDFGVAKAVSDLNECYATSGTHGYMAPEIYIGDHRHGAAADWFAVGVTLHETLCGKRPFEPQRLQAFKDHPRHTDTLSLSCNSMSAMQRAGYMHISSAAKQFLTSLLHVKASHRLGSSAGLREVRAHLWMNRFPWEAMVKRELTMPFKPLVAVPPILSPGPSSPSKSGGHAVFNPSNQSKSLPYSPLSASSVPSTVSASAGNRPPPSQASSRLTYILPTGLMRYNSNQSKSSHASASAKNSSAPACGYFLPPTNASLPSPPRREGSINRYQSRIWPFCLSGEDEGGSCAAAKRGQWLVSDDKYQAVVRQHIESEPPPYAHNLLFEHYKYRTELRRPINSLPHNHHTPCPGGGRSDVGSSSDLHTSSDGRSASGGDDGGDALFTSPLPVPCRSGSGPKMYNGNCQLQVEAEENEDEDIYRSSSEGGDDASGRGVESVLSYKCLSPAKALGSPRSPTINRLKCTASSIQTSSPLRRDPIVTASPPPASALPTSADERSSQRLNDLQLQVIESKVSMRLVESTAIGDAAIHSPLATLPEDSRQPRGKLRRLDRFSPASSPISRLAPYSTSHGSSALAVGTGIDSACNIKKADTIPPSRCRRSRSRVAKRDPPRSMSGSPLCLKPLREVASRGHSYASLPPEVFYHAYPHRTESFFRPLPGDELRGDLTRTLSREPPFECPL